MAVVTDTHITFSLPENLNSLDTIDAVIDECRALSTSDTIRGMTTLIKNMQKYRIHFILLDKYHTAMKCNVAYINRDRTKKQKRGDTKRSLRSTAHKYYSSLSTALLRSQCALFNVDYDAHENIDDIIDALVTKHIEMASTN